jgi:predicted AAA+ superfamily ATPase
MDKEQIKYLLTVQASSPFRKIIARDQFIPYDAGKIISLIGMRRVGKTCLLYQRMQQLVDSGVDRRQIVYINFEDDRISEIKPTELALIPQAHGELYPELHDKPRYYFFDEIQNAPGWERFCRRIYDTEHAQIVVTGSSSHFLARDVATELRGRSISIEIFPLSFKEFLSFRDITFDPYSEKSEQKLFAELEIYLRVGGLPEVVLATEEVRPLILKEYADLILYKDLIDRHHLSNPTVMKQLLRHCLSSPASLLNVTKIFNDFKSRGLKVGKDTVYRYLEILEESYLIYLLPVADRSLRKRAINPKKMHLIDWAIGYTYMPQELMDRGHKLENAVFLHERRQQQDLGYLASPHEIDIVDSLEHPQRLINVCWSLNNRETAQREILSLSDTPHKKCEKILVVHELSADIDVPPDIKVITAWRYLYGLAGGGVEA